MPMCEPGTPVCLIPPINLGDLLPALVTSSEARSSFLPTRQPVQSFNQSNPTLHLYSLSRLEGGRGGVGEAQTGLGRRRILPLRLRALTFGLPL